MGLGLSCQDNPVESNYLASMARDGKGTVMHQWCVQSGGYLELICEGQVVHTSVEFGWPQHLSDKPAVPRDVAVDGFSVWSRARSQDGATPGPSAVPRVRSDWVAPLELPATRRFAVGIVDLDFLQAMDALTSRPSRLVTIIKMIISNTPYSYGLGG